MLRVAALNKIRLLNPNVRTSKSHTVNVIWNRIECGCRTAEIAFVILLLILLDPKIGAFIFRSKVLLRGIVVPLLSGNGFDC
jgi:hypothetical protein